MLYVIAIVVLALLVPGFVVDYRITAEVARDFYDRGPILRGRSGMRLSERFQQYYQLVATSGAKGDQSLAVLASDIYLDMEETSALIRRTRQEIARATLMEQLNQSFGNITPEMIEVVGGVKSILFGDDDSRALVAGPPPGWKNSAGSVRVSPACRRIGAQFRPCFRSLRAGRRKVPPSAVAS